MLSLLYTYPNNVSIQVVSPVKGEVNIEWRITAYPFHVSIQVVSLLQGERRNGRAN
jgi:hypothetical protein